MKLICSCNCQMRWFLECSRFRLVHVLGYWSQAMTANSRRGDKKMHLAQIRSSFFNLATSHILEHIRAGTAMTRAKLVMHSCQLDLLTPVLESKKSMRHSVWAKALLEESEFLSLWVIFTQMFCSHIVGQNEYQISSCPKVTELLTKVARLVSNSLFDQTLFHHLLLGFSCQFEKNLTGNVRS